MPPYPFLYFEQCFWRNIVDYCISVPSYKIVLSFYLIGEAAYLVNFSQDNIVFAIYHITLSLDCILVSSNEVMLASNSILITMHYIVGFSIKYVVWTIYILVTPYCMIMGANHLNAGSAYLI